MRVTRGGEPGNYVENSLVKGQIFASVPTKSLESDIHVIFNGHGELSCHFGNSEISGH